LLCLEQKCRNQTVILSDHITENALAYIMWNKLAIRQDGQSRTECRLGVGQDSRLEYIG